MNETLHAPNGSADWPVVRSFPRMGTEETQSKQVLAGGARGAVGNPPHGGVGNAGHDDHAARNDEGRRGGGIGGKSQSNAQHVDRVPASSGRANRRPEF